MAMFRVVTHFKLRHKKLTTTRPLHADSDSGFVFINHYPKKKTEKRLIASVYIMERDYVCKETDMEIAHEYLKNRRDVQMYDKFKRQ